MVIVEIAAGVADHNAEKKSICPEPLLSYPYNDRTVLFLLVDV